MAVKCFFGLTRSGKSYLAAQKLKAFRRSIVFDFIPCFDIAGAFVVYDFSPENIRDIFRKFEKKDNYCIIFRPNKERDLKEQHSWVARTALKLGEAATLRGVKEHLVFLTDEADMVCSPNFQSIDLMNVVNWGRHHGVDSWFISRLMQRIHVDIRANASEFFIFRLMEENALKYIGNIAGKGVANEVKNLREYYHMVIKDDGSIKKIDPKGKEVKNDRKPNRD